MFTDFKRYIKEYNLFSGSDRVLLAVSGGIDSMVMAHLFHKTAIKTGIAHCNFALRGEESDKDEELVKRFASENNLPFYSVKFETENYAKEHGISIQMAARELRYNWFETIRREYNFDCIAVAHNLNDNIETLLINLVRGTGIAGLSGMKPVNDKIVRPLLFASRTRIAGYCDTHNITFREDQSNQETKYTRNKIRHLVIPVLKEINPSIEETLNDTAAKMAGINEVVTNYIDNLRNQISFDRNGTTFFSINKLQVQLSNTAIVFELFRPYGITASLIGDLIKVINGGSGRQILTRSHRMIKDRGELIISKHGKLPDRIFEISDIDDLHDVPCIGSAEIIATGPDFKLSHDPHVAFIDYKMISMPMLIRPWRKGDFFFPLGMKKKKKLSDYFIDEKYPVTKKEQALILESAGRIIWIIGERIDDRFKVTESTVKVLRIESTGC